MILTEDLVFLWKNKYSYIDQKDKIQVKLLTRVTLKKEDLDKGKRQMKQVKNKKKVGIAILISQLLQDKIY